MRPSIPAFALLACLSATAALAQETAAPAEGGDQTGTETVLPMGEPVAPDGGQIGTPYTKEEHGDWDIRCVRTQSGNDPCQLYQLLNDAEGNSVAEIAIFPLMPVQGDAVAGGNIITPLETLLTQQVTLQVDGSEARRYPFAFCTQAGCFARIGYAAADIDRLKRGAKATVSIVPVVAPTERIELAVSLSGFTAGYDALVKLMQAQIDAAGAAGAAEGATGGATDGTTDGTTGGTGEGGN
jgi:invasion protein IalB